MEQVPLKSFEIAVIGGGPAGLMAAETLARSGMRVMVFDQMSTVGRKFLMAGRGGLNLTHSEPLDRFLSRYGAPATRLAPVISAFPPDSVRAWCEGLGEATFLGSSGRVFPKSLKASPLLRAWRARLSASGVRFVLRRRWVGWDDGGALCFVGPDGDHSTTFPDATVLALGGASWPRLGSDGSWVDLLETRGIPVTPLRPANCGFKVDWSEHFRSRFAGVPLKRIALTFDGATVRGEALVTSTGIEGGAVYVVSAALRDAIDRDGSAVTELDLRPDLAADALARRLAAPRSRQSLSTFLRKAAGLAPVSIALLREPSGEEPPRDPHALAACIKGVRLRMVAAQGLERAISTAGGIPFDEIDDDYMLIRAPGVFAAGEMLDWEAPTGGYLLQASFATGAAAARGVIQWLARTRQPDSRPAVTSRPAGA